MRSLREATNDETHGDADPPGCTASRPGNGLNIRAQAGAVIVAGRPGLTNVQVKATACASNDSALRKIKLTTDRSSDGWIRVLADVPWGTGKLDITVEVPEDLPAMVRSESGTVAVADVKRGVSLDSRSGSVTVGIVTHQNVTGKVSVPN